MTFCSCPGQQFYPNKWGRKYRKVLSMEQEGETHATKVAQSKGARKLLLHFLHQYMSALSTEKLLARTQDPPSPGLQSAGAQARQPVAQGRVGMSHPQLTQERSQDPCRKPSHFCPSEGRDFSNLFSAVLLSTILPSSATGTSDHCSYRKGWQGSPKVWASPWSMG